MKATRLELHGKKHRYGLNAFLLGLITAFVIFLPFIILNKGMFLYYGDYNVQQITFYQLIHDSILSGNIGWSHHTDLGANIIGSYSFYLLGSPFFWVTLLFPSKLLPFLMGPLLILKTALCSLTAYIFLRRYVHNKNFAVLGGLLYAFSGFAAYNVFFNHFHDVMVFFPLLLWALDEFVLNKRRGVLALLVLSSCVVNYYFFVGEVFFVIIYWAVRMVTRSYRMKFKEFLLMVFEVVLGFAASAVILIPSVLAVVQNTRVSNTLEGWNAIVYDIPQKYVHILESFLFIPDLPAFPNFTPDSNAKWASISAWLPLFSVTGVIAYIQTKSHKNYLKKLIVIFVVMAFIPITNSLFQLFNIQFYTRWFYMLILLMCLATVKSFEDTNVDWSRAIAWNIGLTGAVAAAIGFMPYHTENDNGEKEIKFGLMKYPERFWQYVAISFICIAVVLLLVTLLKKNRRKFIAAAMAATIAVSAGYSIFILGMGESYNMGGINAFMRQNIINRGSDIDLPDSDIVRSDFYEMSENMGMFWKLPTIQAFHSIVPGSVMEFYSSIGVTRDVGSRPETSVYGLRSFTSTKYLFDQCGDSKSFIDEDGNTEMPGWKLYDTQNNCNIYENEYYIPMGFSYDEYITRQDLKNCIIKDRNLLLLKAMVLSDEQMEKYKDITENHKGNLSDYSYTTEDYYKDCNARKSSVCTSFEYNNSGFTATADRTGKDDTLMFFSVPYENGWSAYVNGEKVDVENVNVGFMAVRVPGGKVSEIKFTYETPGLNIGICITLSCMFIFALYMIIWGRKANKRIKDIKKPLTLRVKDRVKK